MTFSVITLAIWVIKVKELCKPIFENKKLGNGGGIPALKTIWEIFDLSLLFSQTGIRKHSGIATWLIAFSYICGLVANVGSVNRNAAYIGESPVLQQILSGNMITQSAFSRFLSKPFNWLKFSLGRLSRLQERTETRLTDGDIIALDDTKIEHPHGKKLPFLCWLFDSSDKQHVWCMNLVSTLAVLKNGLEYPVLWRFWVKKDQENEKQTKLDLAKQMLSDFRSINDSKVWVAMDRWFLCKPFLVWLVNQNFDWVTKAKRNTVLFRKIYDPVLKKETFVKLNPGYLLCEVYPKLRILGRERILSIPDIYIKLPYEDITRKGKPITRHRFTPIAAIAATYSKQADDSKVVLPEEEAAATFRDAYLLISNRVDAPEEVAYAYVKRWRIEVFYRAVKQDLGLTSCYAQSDTAHFAHVELLFTAKTLLCYAFWELNKEGAEQAPTHSEMVRYFFNASCRINCCKQQILIHFDMTTKRFARLIENFWPKLLEIGLWSWDIYPETA
jgi:hypothetical protein